MNPFWSDTVARLQPYVPGEQPRDRSYIKLNTNENPYPPSERVREAIVQATDESLRLYPDPASSDLCAAIARHVGLDAAQVFVGNGSDEVLALAFQAFLSGRRVVAADITYSFYPVFARLYGADYHTVALDDAFALPVGELCAGHGAVLLANPNAPTGRLLELPQVERIVASQPDRPVIVDEAYIDFGGQSAAVLVPTHENLLVVQTLSKSRSLAGLRVGFAIGHPMLIEALRRVKDSFNSYPLDRLAQAGAQAALADEEYYQGRTRAIIATRERVAQALAGRAFHVIPSRANFLFISHGLLPAAELFGRLRDQGILVRHFDLPRIDNWLRVTIGTDGEMDAFLQAIDMICPPSG